MLERQDKPLQNISPLLNQRIDDLKGELGEAMKLIAEIENKSLMASRTPSQVATPTRTRSNTPTKGKRSPSMNGSFSTSTYKSSGVKSRTLTSTLPNTSGLRGPFISDIQTADHPEGDDLPLDPCFDEEDEVKFYDQGLVEDLQIILPEPGFNSDPADVLKESAIVKEKMTKIGTIITNLEKLDFEESKQAESQIMEPNSPMLKPKPNIEKRSQQRKNLGLFFGHENWNLIMNMMIGFRAGLKQ